MQTWLQENIHLLLGYFALPEIGLSAIFVVSLVSATLLPLGSEPVVFAYVSLNPQMFWPAVIIATAGNTIGGIISYGMGAGLNMAWLKYCHNPQDQANKARRWHIISRQWLTRFGPPALLLSWLPGVGDPLCAVAGWLRLQFLPCVIYMAIGKFLRYVIFTIVLLKAWNWFV